MSGFGWPAEFQVQGDPNWYTTYTLPLDPSAVVQVTLRVMTDSDLRIGEGSLVADSQVGGQHYSVGFQVFNNSPAVLLVDDDGTSTYETDFQAGLTAGNYLYNTFSVASGSDGPTAADLAPYDAVIWQTGFGLTTLTASDIAALTTYVDNGGGLFLQSMEYLGLNGANPFTTNYLGVASYVNNAKADAAEGISGDPITDGMSFPVLQWPAAAYNKADVVNPIPEAERIFNKQTGEPIAVRYERPNGARVVFNTVLLVAFGSDPDPNNKTQVVVKTMDWILGGGNPADVPTDQPTPSVSQMMAASPNPFTPATQLSFALSNAAAQEPVSLVVVDAAGRQVRKLVDGHMDAGFHHVGWDGRDDAGRTAPSGLYFAVLHSADGSSSSKLTRIE
ncbi:MAG: FlgD immunoglobulin-like domain containing protein [Candidatus Eisenbacteria bacterium]